MNGSEVRRFRALAALSVLVMGLAVLLTATTPARATNFTRGDTNADGAFDLSDGVNVLSFLFGTGPFNIPCDDAADANDDSRMDLSDASFIFNHLFLGGRPPFAPTFPECGEDPTDDDGLDCVEYPTCPQIPPDEDPPVISNLLLSNVTQTSATISFETDEPATSRLDYGDDDNYGETFENTELATVHSFDLDELDAGAEYHYQLTVEDEVGNAISTADAVFATIPDRSLLSDAGHAVNRLTYGPTPALMLAFSDGSLTVGDFINTQLDPQSIDESGNTALNDRLAELQSSERFHDVEPVVARGSLWRYLKGTAEPPADWATPEFDDGAWLESQAGFGYGDGDDNTVLGDMRARADDPETPDVDESRPGYLSVYLRKTFRIAELDRIDDLLLEVRYDDGFVAYLNGTEIARAGLAGNPPPFNAQAASHEATGFEEFDITDRKDLLVEGDNVLAVQGHNRDLNSSDMSIHPALLDRETDVRPPVSRIGGLDELQHLIHARGVYSERQLQAVLGEFWENHFTTDSDKVAEYMATLRDVDGLSSFSESAARREASHLDHLEYEFFYDNALGYFGDMLLYSATSPSMTIYLDNVLNVKADPNENYSREYLELYAFGVDNRYNQIDIEELARCFTGWTICKVSEEDQQPFPLSSTNPPVVCPQTFDDLEIPGTGTGLAGNWRYFKGTEEPSPVDNGEGELEPTWDWAYPDFDDSTWLEGTTTADEGVGYEAGNDDPVLSASIDLSDMRGNYVQVFLRKEVIISQEEIDNLDNLLLAVDEYDDGYVAFLNGIPIAQSTSFDDNTNDGPYYDNEAFPFDESTDDGHERGADPTEYWNVGAAAEALRPAPEVNILAFQMANTSLNSSDLSLRARLVNRVLGPDTVMNRDPSAVWTLRFNAEEHDQGAKTLFDGTPWQIDIPAGREGVDGMRDVLDVIEASEDHPSVKEFICVKLIQKFVSDEISVQSVVRLREPGLTAEERDALVPAELRGLLADMIATWETPSGPDGRVGHIGSVMRTLLGVSAEGGIDFDSVFWQDIAFRSKVRTPVEYINAGLRLLQADVDSSDADKLPDWADDMGMHLFNRDEPDGWDETGLAWGDTAQYQQRFLFNQDLAANNDGDFTWDTQAFLDEHDIATADEIVHFFSEVMFHGTLSNSNEELLMDFLTTDDNGNPRALTPGAGDYVERVEDFVGLLLSMPQWHFQ